MPENRDFMLSVKDRRSFPYLSVASLAGTGLEEYKDGPGSMAGFNFPQGVAADTKGNVYVADTSNNVIRKINASGVVSTLAGDGTFGFRDARTNIARFNYPTGIASDGAGNILVADKDNHLIRKISPERQVTTLAGDGLPGWEDGKASEARFNYPTDVAVDMAGFVYVADQGNHCIRMITPSGVVLTVAGNGTPSFRDGMGTDAAFNFPSGVAVDAGGQVFVADSCNNLVRQISISRVVTTLAGSGSGSHEDGIGADARFHYPYGISVDLVGNILVADTYNNRIRLISAGGSVKTLAGNGQRSGREGPVAEAAFSYPTGVAIDAAGNIFVADAGNNRIRVLRPASQR